MFLVMGPQSSKTSRRTSVQSHFWIFQQVRNGWCSGCRNTPSSPSLRVQTAPFGRYWLNYIIMGPEVWCHSFPWFFNKSSSLAIFGKWGRRWCSMTMEFTPKNIGKWWKMNEQHVSHPVCWLFSTRFSTKKQPQDVWSITFFDILKESQQKEAASKVTNPEQVWYFNTISIKPSYGCFRK